MRGPRTIAEYKAQASWSEREIRQSRLLYLIHTLSRLVSVRFDRAMARHGITHAQWWALANVYENEGATQSELAAIMQVGRASAGWLFQRLEDGGWIVRRDDPTDSRLRRVYLGDAAVPILKLMDREVPDLFETFFSDLSVAKERQLLTTLQLLRKKAEL